MTLINDFGILAIGAHPDDFELGCGGFLYNCRMLGANVSGLVVTDGSFTPPDCEVRCKKNRKREALLASQVLNLNHLAFGRLRDKQVEARSVEQLVANRLSVCPAHLVLTHIGNDGHVDHEAVSNGVMTAIRNLALAPTLMYFEIPLHRYVTDFVSSNAYFANIDKSIQKKLRAIGQHKSEVARKSISLDEVQEIAIARAGNSRNPHDCKFAEAFYFPESSISRRRVLDGLPNSISRMLIS